MSKKKKKKKDEQQANGSVEHAPEVSFESAPADGSAPVAEAKKKRTKAAPKKTAAKKSTATPAARKSGTKRSAIKNKAYEPTDDEIRLRAYFIAERRARTSGVGDPAQDWLDARRELIEEFGQS